MSPARSVEREGERGRERERERDKPDFILFTFVLLTRQCEKKGGYPYEHLNLVWVYRQQRRYNFWSSIRV